MEKYRHQTVQRNKLITLISLRVYQRKMLLITYIYINDIHVLNFMLIILYDETDLWDLTKVIFNFT
jgi:hypothetical protein